MCIILHSDLRRQDLAGGPRGPVRGIRRGPGRHLVGHRARLGCEALAESHPLVRGWSDLDHQRHRSGHAEGSAWGPSALERAQYVLSGTQYLYPGDANDVTQHHMIARSCNGRVWDYTTICSTVITMDHLEWNTYCGISYTSTAAMTVVVVKHPTYDFDGYYVHGPGRTWELSLNTVVVGDP